MDTPDYMPVLSGGCHSGPDDGACIMEYVSFIHGSRWTDTPDCTPEGLAYLAQWANDTIDSANRHVLVPMIPRLLGQGQSEEFDKVLADWLRIEADLGYGGSVSQIGEALLSKRIYEAGVDMYTVPSAGGPVAYHQKRGEFILGILADALDLYDEFLGREKVDDLKPEEVEAVQRLTALITA